MPLLHARPAVALAAAVILGGPLSGCAALNPVSGVSAGRADTWTPSSGRVAVATRRPARRIPATPPPAPPRSAVEAGPAVRVDAPVFLGVAGSSGAAVTSAIRQRGDDWLGVRYRFGGESRSGIDCSAFTRQIFRETFGMELPRNTALQVQEGVSVQRQDIAPGDLVFFRRGGTRHVGIYLGDNEFIHASASRGVTISNMDEDYYRRYYWTARRVLNGAPAYADAGELRRRPMTRAERTSQTRGADSARAVPASLQVPEPIESTTRRGW
jgi:cell wall-associated NlpC family hydrolase